MEDFGREQDVKIRLRAWRRAGPYAGPRPEGNGKRVLGHAFGRRAERRGRAGMKGLTRTDRQLPGAGAVVRRGRS